MAEISGKTRSIHFLTPEQLEKKRIGDRLSQKHKRERTKAQIDSLQQQVDELRQRNQTLEDRLKAQVLQRQESSAEKKEVTSPVSPQGGRPLSDGAFDTIVADSSSIWDGETPGNDIWQMLCENPPGLDFTTWSGYSGCIDEDSIDPATLDCQSLPWDTNGNTNTSSTSMPRQISSPGQVWSTIPKHTAPTCLLDSVLIDLTRQRRQQDNASEFQKNSFPSIQSLLNPSSEQQARTSPVSFTIVNKIIRVMTVPTLPEQIAILHVMSAVVRWLISPTEANYDAMPEWLRPGAAQLAVPHAPWIDLLPWPRARERMCRWPKYHGQHALISAICNESLVINWPHHTADIVLHCNKGEAVLNPIFDRHIRNIDNWTVGKKLIDVFPELEGEVNIA